MTEAEVTEVLACLQRAGLDLWIDGGWGVDALLSAQTRDHDDLDLAMNRDDVGVARDALEALAYEHDPTSEPGLPARFVLRGTGSRQVDIHPLHFDSNGDGWQQLSETGKALGHYPVADLAARGRIAGREVQ